MELRGVGIRLPAPEVNGRAMTGSDGAAAMATLGRECHQFGNEGADCVRTYAPVAHERKDLEANDCPMDEAEAEAATGETGPQTPSVKEMTGDDLVAKQGDAAITAQRDNTKENKQTKEDAEKDGKCLPQGTGKAKETNAEEDEQTRDSEIEAMEDVEANQVAKRQRELSQASAEDGGGGGLPWQPTKRALADERKFALANEITAVDQNGVVSSDKDDIKTVFVAYHVELFGSKDRPKDMTAINDLLRTAPELSQEAKEWMEEPITLSEIDRAIEGLATHKTPGPDGLCAEFYQHFRAQLCPFDLEVLREACELQAVGPPRVACDVNHRTHYVTCATGVVYQIPLSCGRVYIGQTGSAVGCTNNPVRNPELRFHQFPRDRKRHKVWVGAVRRIDFGRPSIPSSNAKLCSQHFTSDTYTRDLRPLTVTGFSTKHASLKNDAVPSLFAYRPPGAPARSAGLSRSRLI
ncbi:hypothetical protein HPB47_019669 [Ixodes persulcatus]|uniref:Uncharacterized protein n=1 Tax=Ixodes persulcatus TaxID=34615 RepID=A0AC60QJS3_IXOPE|nr:hypothetical protein HPB47_019669 [Ixodes persulcatus]